MIELTRRLAIAYEREKVRLLKLGGRESFGVSPYALRFECS